VDEDGIRLRERNIANDCSAGAGCALDVELAAHRLESVAEPAEAGPGRVGAAHAVVRDLNPETFSACSDRDADALRLRMLHSVCKRL
jgi:hypothetical protein